MKIIITIITISIIGCWIGEWSKLIQNMAWVLNKKWIDFWFGCAKCWAFWIGVNYFTYSQSFYYGIVYGILASATAQIMNKIYMRL